VTIANVLDVASSVAATTRDDDVNDDDGATPRARTPSSSSVSVSRGASEDARDNRDDEESKGETRSIGHPYANLIFVPNTRRRTGTMDGHNDSRVFV
jgi:hypothetical protein